ncbi:hypothetical protein [Stenotrophomonas sp. PS02289]|uniref:hypothetical protein n=1 Tax=Stenotrophomonas sp. PS02289 TaxID=2991422 RepID=UPI00249C945C|nr:hypothetical protein [Stenotrophomonas sp. PS02289]
MTRPEPTPDSLPGEVDPARAYRRRCITALLRGLAVLVAIALSMLLTWLVPSAAAQPVEPGPRVSALHGHLELDYTIVAQVDDLAVWAVDHDPRQLVPFIEGRALVGNTPESVDLANGRVLFHLRISDDSKTVWTDLLGSPEGLRRKVSFSVGPADGSPFDTALTGSGRVELTVISPVYGGIALGLVVVTLAVFVHLARTTSIIRKPGPWADAPYDLGRFQMAVWFFLIYLSYTAIWLITDATDTINPSLLALLGISAGTALSEAVIDSGTPAAGVEATSAVSQGLLHDLLSDETGYRFDRFQIFAFTLILGVIFLSDVYNNLSMPELSPTLLGLMGLSSGTYIGFKLPDRR